jgi:transcriptional regulator of acetoin/glycerol metabolism
MNRKPLRLSPEALEALKGYEWPGNVRELQNAIERAVVVGSPPTVAVQDLPLRVTDAPARPRTRSLEEVEKAHIGAVLDSCNWNITQAARILEVDRGTLYNRLKNYGLKRPLDGTQ